MIDLLWPDEQIVRYKLLKHSATGVLVEFDGSEIFIPHTSYVLYKKIKGE